MLNFSKQINHISNQKRILFRIRLSYFFRNVNLVVKIVNRFFSIKYFFERFCQINERKRNYWQKFLFQKKEKSESKKIYRIIDYSIKFKQINQSKRRRQNERLIVCLKYNAVIRIFKKSEKSICKQIKF